MWELLQLVFLNNAPYNRPYPGGLLQLVAIGPDPPKEKEKRTAEEILKLKLHVKRLINEKQISRMKKNL